MICVVCPRICDVIEYLLAVETVSFRHGEHSDGSESPLCIDVKTFPFAAAHIYGKLSGFRQCRIRRLTAERDIEDELT